MRVKRGLTAIIVSHTGDGPPPVGSQAIIRDRMTYMDNTLLIDRAKSVLRYRQLTEECVAGEVGAALLTADGNVYVGVSISAACGIGFCAEHSAIAQMVTHGETHIIKLVAIAGDGKCLSPCGRCREFLYQVDRKNLKTEVLLSVERAISLEALLPERWQKPPA